MAALALRRVNSIGQISSEGGLQNRRGDSFTPTRLPVAKHMKSPEEIGHKSKRERGLRVTILTGFALVIGLTIVIAAWSYYNITALGDAQENLFIANYKSIQYAHEIDSKVETLRDAYGTGALTMEYFGAIDRECRQLLSDEFHNITEPGEREIAVRLQDSYDALIQGLSTHAATASIAQLCSVVRQNGEALVGVNEKGMFLRADAAKGIARFARYSTLLITFALVIVAALLALGVSNRSLAEFRQLDRAKSNFVATAAHELRNPLSSIKTSTSMMLDEIAGPINQRQREVLTNVRVESERLLTLVRELLDLARLEAGTLQFSFSKIGVYALIESAVVPVMMQAERSGVEIAIRVTPGVPDIVADPNKISWAITNVLLNAIRYSHRSSTVIANASEIDNEVWISVTDEGKGIADKDRERIFEKFVQVEDAVMGGGTGSGLGLSIANEIVLAHQGRIWVDSTPGKGSTFTMALPIDRKPDGVAAPAM